MSSIAQMLVEARAYFSNAAAWPASRDEMTRKIDGIDIAICDEVLPWPLRGARYHTSSAPYQKLLQLANGALA